MSFDLGAGGVIASGQNQVVNAHEELFEELGINVNIEVLKNIKCEVLTPSSGFCCIVHNYVLEMNSNDLEKFTSSDGTFSKFLWKSIEDIKTISDKIRSDPATYFHLKYQSSD